MELELQNSVQGAKRQSQKRANPRDVLLRIMKENEGAPEDEIMNYCWEQVRDDDAYLRTIFDYWFANNYRSLAYNWGRPSPQVEMERRTRESRIAAAVEPIKAAIIAKAPAIALLGLKMANGKKLANCSGADCSHLGGWLARVAEKVGPDQLVGDALTEEQVRELYAE